MSFYNATISFNGYAKALHFRGAFLLSDSLVESFIQKLLGRIRSQKSTEGGNYNFIRMDIH